jgi:hypothetical protein
MAPGDAGSADVEAASRIARALQRQPRDLVQLKPGIRLGTRSGEVSAAGA